MNFSCLNYFLPNFQRKFARKLSTFPCKFAGKLSTPPFQVLRVNLRRHLLANACACAQGRKFAFKLSIPLTSFRQVCLQTFNPTSQVCPQTFNPTSQVCMQTFNPTSQVCMQTFNPASQVCAQTFNPSSQVCTQAFNPMCRITVNLCYIFTFKIT